MRDQLSEGEEIWCMSGWAEALRRRTAKLKKNVASDVHGNQLRRTKLFKVTLSIKRVNGAPLAKIKEVMYYVAYYTNETLCINLNKVYLHQIRLDPF